MAQRLRTVGLFSALLVAGASATAYAEYAPITGPREDGRTAAQQTKPAAAAPVEEEAKPKPPEAKPPATGRLADLIDPIKKWSDYLFGGVLGVALGFLAKWWLEQVSARVAARREFAKEVTKQISSLAEKHYWALANEAGVLAGQLEGHLASRTAHLIITWDSRAALRTRLDELAAEAGEKSFFHLCQMIWLFDSFQFQGSTTYLLTSHSAGDMCKRLYNMFVESLPGSDFNIARIRELTDEVPVISGDKVSMVQKKLRDLPAGTLTEAKILADLKAERVAYIEWLRHNVMDVSTAAGALRAFNELLNHELALLYRVWFSTGAKYPERHVYEQQFGQWPDLLTRQSADTLALASYQSNLLRPLGSAGAAQPAAIFPLLLPREKPEHAPGRGYKQGDKAEPRSKKKL